MEIVAQGEMQKLRRDFERRARFRFDEYQNWRRATLLLGVSSTGREVVLEYQTWWHRMRFGFNEYHTIDFVEYQTW